MRDGAAGRSGACGMIRDLRMAVEHDMPGEGRFGAGLCGTMRALEALAGRQFPP